MSTLAESLGEIKKPWQWLLIGGAILLIWGALAFPTLHHADLASTGVRFQPAPQTAQLRPVQGYAAPMMKAKPEMMAGIVDASKDTVAASQADGDLGRRIVRTSSMEIVVQHPADVAEKITALAESMGGYLATADGGGQNATTGTLTIRVPAARFEEARVQIRKLGLRVENERINAEDVTRQYVDQDASIRNLRAEEAQYLAILKQATTVKDMLAVTEQLSEVRGQIEQQQAEFNALSKQIETVAIAISLRTEPTPQALGWSWHPGDQLKLALHDGLDSLATYAAAMTAILFYLPATLLWVGTIVLSIVVGWRLLRWIGRRWFGWTEAALNS